MQDYGRKNSEHISIGNWIFTLILLFIPGINIIAGIFYLCSKKKSKRNYILAIIILILALAVLCVGAYLVIRFGFPSFYDKLATLINDSIQLIKDLFSAA